MLKSTWYVAGLILVAIVALFSVYVMVNAGGQLAALEFFAGLFFLTLSAAMAAGLTVARLGQRERERRQEERWSRIGEE